MKELVVQLIALFLIVQVIGLFTAINLIGQQVEVKIITENPEEIVNAVGLFAYIIGITVVILLLIKFLPSYWVFKLLESLALIGTSFIVFGAIFNDVIDILGAAFILFIRNKYPKSIASRNASAVVASAGAGALIGVSLGLMPIILFIVLLSVYDLIAVFKTKHMVKMAKHVIKQNLAFTFALPTRVHVFELGTGDLVIPLVVASSIIRFWNDLLPMKIIIASAVLFASLIGLVWTLEISQKIIGRPLPALPLQTASMILMLGLLWLAGI